MYGAVKCCNSCGESTEEGAEYPFMFKSNQGYTFNVSNKIIDTFYEDRNHNEIFNKI